MANGRGEFGLGPNELRFFNVWASPTGRKKISKRNAVRTAPSVAYTAKQTDNETGDCRAEAWSRQRLLRPVPSFVRRRRCDGGFPCLNSTWIS